ncbi:heavy metal translocating P-type ATPase [Rhodohalobacter halophilus]|uniref:heavy metal translocating P-type ATPase n=1 Tax=Rhodohalobacter halophilus TaxID=1812810 RepID=UPI00083F65D4|nr:heavy metal translocating P-type ATPase [Rhodohalobacter halophilus]
MAHSHSNGTREIILTALCAVTLILGIVSEHTEILPKSLAIWFYLLSYATGGYQGLIETIDSLRKFELNIDFLMIAAALGAAVLGEWIEGATLLFLFSLSGALESYALGKSRNAIHSLLELRPSQGLRKNDDGAEELIPIEELRVGDIVIVKPGEHIPIDGKVIKGQTTVDQATITGESIPVSKDVGDSVFAATLNENGVIELEVTKPAKDTTVSKIIDLVESAQKNKAKTQRFLETFEPRYAITVITAVILLIFIPWLVLGHDFDPTFYRAMTVLVVASPCALIISTPASIISAIANGAKSGILFKGGVHVEQTVEIDTIAFDKTGTLTLGKPAVEDVIFYNAGSNLFETEGDNVNKLLALAAGSEMHSEHHLAEAIINKAGELDIEPHQVENMQATPGQGVKAEWEDHTISVGNLKMFEGQLDSWNRKIKEKAAELRSEGKTVVFVAMDGQPQGLISLADQIRPDSKMMLQKLKSEGIKKVAMLTGDNLGVAEAIAGELGIDEIYADLLPEQKVEVINRMKQSGTVAMVGDGVNDAPALATSDLGIAMGAAGTDVALETADIVLMGDDLSKLPYLLKLSRKAKKVVWQNIGFSLSVIVVLLFGVFLIDLPLTLGVIGHEGSTLLVVLNGLRLLGSRNLT